MTELFPEIHIEYPDRRYLTALEVREWAVSGSLLGPNASAKKISEASEIAVVETK